MPLYILSKQINNIKFEIFLDIDFDNLGNVCSYEFYDGFFYYENPSDIRFSKVYCDESNQYEWDFFIDGLLQLFDSKILFKKIEKLKKEGDSYYFNKEEIDVIIMEID